MSDMAIKVEGLSKRYRIGAQQQGASKYKSLREELVRALHGPVRRAGRLLRGEPYGATEMDETIWALKDVSFEVERGEVLGIIGANGAGKTTLLKILSRITEPTAGHAEIHGRVGSLLEVGTGFHPELTGRENVYLNGAILGMTRTEIDRKFDEIVDFSGVERFIDTPVKHYSSGMHVRLAFAVAAHLDPEILLIDEVLAVGDAAFQKKCLGKMGDVAREGRTVLFVSHNMVAVQNLCERVMWLDEGNIVGEGRPDEVVSEYLQTTVSSSTEQVWTDVDSAPGNEKVRLRGIRVRPENGTPSDVITMQTGFVVEVEFLNLVPDAVLDITLHFHNEQGIVAFGSGSGTDRSHNLGCLPSGLFRSACHVPPNLVNSGMHRVVVLVVENRSRVIYRHEDAVSFEVIDPGENRGGWYGKRAGVVRPQLEWTKEQLDDQIRSLAGERSLCS